jgi:hypothetical protein
MRGLLAVWLLTVAPLLSACLDRGLVSPGPTSSPREPTAAPNPSTASIVSASPPMSAPTASHGPIGSLPDDCPPGPDPTPVSDHVGSGVGAEPAWAIGFGPGATLQFTRDDPYDGHGWLRKVLWLLRSTAGEAVTITGIRVDDRAPLWFDYANDQPRRDVLVLDPAAPDGEHLDWYEYRGFFVVPSAACYHLTAAWPGGGWELDFSAGLDPTAT